MNKHMGIGKYYSYAYSNLMEFLKELAAHPMEDIRVAMANEFVNQKLQFWGFSRQVKELIETELLESVVYEDDEVTRFIAVYERIGFLIEGFFEFNG